MALTRKLGSVVDCFPDKSIFLHARGLDSDDEAEVEAAADWIWDYTQRYEPDALNKQAAAYDELFAMIRNKRKLLTDIPTRTLLDIGSGGEGSYFVNRYAQEFNRTNVVYLDNFEDFLKELKKPNKVKADARKLPFKDNAFDIGCAFAIIADGITSSNNNYGLVKEARRVIRPGGYFIFNYVPSQNDWQTVLALDEIGFKEIEHLQRILWMYGIPKDIYAAR